MYSHASGFLDYMITQYSSGEYMIESSRTNQLFDSNSVNHNEFSLTIFFNVDRADQLDCRRSRDNIKKVVRQTLRAGKCFVIKQSTTIRCDHHDK